MSRRALTAGPAIGDSIPCCRRAGRSTDDLSSSPDHLPFWRRQHLLARHKSTVPQSNSAWISMGLRSQSTQLMLALQMGRSTLIGCETNPLGGVTTKLPQRGHASPVEVSIAYAVTSAVATSPEFSVRWGAALAGRRGTLISTPPAGVTRSAPGYPTSVQACADVFLKDKIT